MGYGFGIKTADPGARMVLGGLAGAGASQDWLTNVETYLQGMLSWSRAHRGEGSFPADVLNVHFYCFGDSTFSDTDPVPALAPEECGLGDLMRRLVAFRDENLPGVEIWLTEFGYDTNPHSRLRAPAVGASTAQAVQGQWLVRSYLELLGSGIDRAFLYVSREQCTGDATACPNNHIQFATSGVLTQKGDETPKTAWYYLAAFRARLGAMRYAGERDTGRDDVRIARFYDASTNAGAYVLWSPTSTGATVDGYARRSPTA